MKLFVCQILSCQTHMHAHIITGSIARNGNLNIRHRNVTDTYMCNGSRFFESNLIIYSHITIPEYETTQNTSTTCNHNDIIIGRHSHKSVTTQHIYICKYVHHENRSLIQSLALMYSAINRIQSGLSTLQYNLKYFFQASSSASSGDMAAAKQFNSASIGCTGCALASAILPFIVLIIYIIAINS